MRRSRFCLYPKQSEPAEVPLKMTLKGNTTKKNAKKVATQKDANSESASAIQTPEPLTEAKLKTDLLDIDASDSDYDYSAENNEEEVFDEEMEQLEKYSHKELLELYDKELDLYRDNMEKVAKIIHSKLTSV